MEKVTPTVGRIVLAHIDIDGEQVLPAIITRVLAENPGGWFDVNVKVFCDSDNCDGTTFRELYFVPLVGVGEGKNVWSEWCEWMPYQIGHAARTEALARESGLTEAE